MYTLRFPFELPLGQRIDVTEQSSQLGALTFYLKKQDRYYVLTVSGFSSEGAAKQYVKVIWAGLAWLLLGRGLSAKADLDFQAVVYAENPYQAAKNLAKSSGLSIEGRVDGSIDGSRPAVYPTDKKLSIITAGEASVVIGTPASDVLQFLLEGISFPQSASVIAEPKLRLALELYGALFTEFSGNARFLTLVMALEVLAPNTLKTQRVLELLDEWLREVEDLEKGVGEDTEDGASLDALKRELLFRREDSIRRRIRTLVYDTLSANGDSEEADKAAKLAVKIYDLRGTLLHEGRLQDKELTEATRDAKQIVERVLKAKFRHVAGID